MADENEFMVSELADKVSNFSQEEDEGGISNKEAVSLHDQISGRISSADVYYNINIDNAKENLTNNYNEAEARGDMEAMKIAQDKLDALTNLVELNNSQGKKYSEAFLNREKLDEGQADEILNFLSKTADLSKTLGDAVSVPISDITKIYAQTVSDNRLAFDHREGVTKELIDFIQSQNLLSNNESVSSIKDIIDKGNLDDDSLMNISEKLKDIHSELDIDKSINELSMSLMEENNNDIIQEKLENMVMLMKQSTKYEQEQLEVQGLMGKDIASSEGEMGQMRTVLRHLADETMESKTLFTLNQLNDNFDRAILTNNNLGEKFSEIGSKFKENAGKVSQAGSGLMQTALTTFAAAHFPMLAPMFAAIDPTNLLQGIQTGVLGILAFGKPLKKLVKGVANLGMKMVGMDTSKKEKKKKPKQGGKVRPGGGNWKTRLLTAGGLAAAGGLAYAFGGDDEDEEEGLDVSTDDISSLDDTIIDDKEIEAMQNMNKDDTSVNVSDMESGVSGTTLALGAGGIAGAYTLGKKFKAGGIKNPINSNLLSKPVAGLANKVKPITSVMGGGLAKKLGGPANKVASLSNKATSLVKKVPRLGGVGGVLTAGLGVYDYATSQNKAERIRAAATTIGTGAGALAGGGIASIFTGAIGYFAGDKIADWLIDPEDYIPDDVKEKGPVAEYLYIHRDMLTHDDYTDEEKEDLSKYSNKLLTKSNIEGFLNEHMNFLTDIPVESRMDALHQILSSDKFQFDTVAPKLYDSIMKAQMDMNKNPDKQKLIRRRGRGRVRSVLPKSRETVDNLNIGEKPVEIDISNVEQDSIVDRNLLENKNRVRVRGGGNVRGYARPQQYVINTGDEKTLSRPQEGQQEIKIISNTPPAPKSQNKSSASKAPTNTDDFGIAIANSLLYS